MTTESIEDVLARVELMIADPDERDLSDNDITALTAVLALARAQVAAMSPKPAKPNRYQIARERAGLTCAQATRQLDVSGVGWIVALEAGRVRPTPYELRKLADLYDVGAEWLAGRSDGRARAVRGIEKLAPDDQQKVADFLRALPDAFDAIRPNDAMAPEPRIDEGDTREVDAAVAIDDMVRVRGLPWTMLTTACSCTWGDEHRAFVSLLGSGEIKVRSDGYVWGKPVTLDELGPLLDRARARLEPTALPCIDDVYMQQRSECLALLSRLKVQHGEALDLLAEVVAVFLGEELDDEQWHEQASQAVSRIGEVDRDELARTDDLADLVERAVNKACKNSAPAWAGVKSIFAIGSGRAQDLCRRHGRDPDTGERIDETDTSKEDTSPTCQQCEDNGFFMMRVAGSARATRVPCDHRGKTDMPEEQFRAAEEYAASLSPGELRRWRSVLWAMERGDGRRVVRADSVRVGDVVDTLQDSDITRAVTAIAAVNGNMLQIDTKGGYVFRVMPCEDMVVLRPVTP